MRRRLLVAGVFLVLLAAAVPVTAFGIVPLFARSHLEEPALHARTSAAPAVAAAPTSQPAGPLVLATGSLRRVDVVHYGTGRVSIQDGAGGRYLRFDEIDVAAAPNMYVYLSDRRDGAPGSYTDLGPLKATSGSFGYPIPASVDVGKLGSVVLWCRAFQVTVTYAPLEPVSSGTVPGP